MKATNDIGYQIRCPECDSGLNGYSPNYRCTNESCEEDVVDPNKAEIR